MTYQEQLNSFEWKNTRQEIIIRDSWQCQSCFNEKLMEGCSQEIVYRKSLHENSEVDAYDSISARRGFAPKSVKKSRNYLGYFSTIAEKYFLELLLSVSEKEADYLENQADYIRAQKSGIFKKHQREVTPESWYELRWLNNQTNELTKMLEEMLKKQYDVTNIRREMTLKPQDYKIYEQERLKIKQDFLFVRGLHVHHQYYQVNKLAWEYPEDALITLCWLCHKDLHENQKIEVLNEDGLCIDRYRYCTRCFGAGEFPEFRHIQNGICFRCDGAKYEELIVDAILP